MTDSQEDPEPDEVSRKGWVRYIYVCTFLVALSALLWGGSSLILLADIPLSLLIAIVLATAVGGATVALRRWNWDKRSKRNSAGKAGTT